MLRLQSFGGVRLSDDSGAAVGAAASTRRALALLSVLSVAGEAGLSRDKLVALLWPDSDADRARHSLTQALYEVRRAGQCEDLFLGNADIRLNASRIVSDVAEFEAAVAAEDFDRAAGLYRGPFLDGFFLSGSPEFERWTSAQRARLETAAAGALERLALDAEVLSDDRRAAEWWQRLAALRPLDSGIAIRLMKSMAAGGDRAGAVRYAQIHEMLLRDELGIAPEPAVAELAQRLREGAPAPQATHAAPSESARSADPGAKASDAPKPRPAWRLPAVLIASAGSLLLVAGIVTARARTGAKPEPIHLSERVVVAPFRVAGASPALAYLREGIVELLSPRLADDSSQSPDAGAVLSAWRAAGLANRTEVPRSVAVSIASRLGAERVVTGSIVGSATRVIVAASVVSVASGDIVGVASAEGPVDSMAFVVDRLATKLLLAQAGADAELAPLVTKSLPALRSYLAGEAAARRRGYRAAIAAYENALRIDSTFARAALRLAWIGDRISDAEASHRGIALAWAARDKLTATDQALLRTWTGPRYPAVATIDEQLSAWRGAVDVAPRTSDAWVALGARLFHEGDITGLPSAGDRARSSLERALALDPRSIRAAELILQLGSRGARPAPDSRWRDTALGDSLSPIAPFLRWHDAVVSGDIIEQHRLRSRFGQLRVSTLRLIAMASQHEGIAPEDGERAARVLLDRASDEGSRADALEALHSFLLNQGRHRQALEVTSQLRALQPGLHAYLRLRVLDAMYGNGDTLAAHAAARELERLAGAGLGGQPVTSATWFANWCVIAQWRLDRGDTTGVRQIISELGERGVNSRRPRIATAPLACAELLDVALAVATKSPGAAARLAQIASLAFTPQTAGDAVTYAPLLLARLHERLGDVDGALRAIRKRSYMSVWPRYLASMLREEAQLVRRSGA